MIDLTTATLERSASAPVIMLQPLANISEHRPLTRNHSTGALGDSKDYGEDDDAISLTRKPRYRRGAKGNRNVTVARRILRPNSAKSRRESPKRDQMGRKKIQPLVRRASTFNSVGSTAMS